jgi:hypothetical protein
LRGTAICEPQGGVVASWGKRGANTTACLERTEGLQIPRANVVAQVWS